MHDRRKMMQNAEEHHQEADDRKQVIRTTVVLILLYRRIGSITLMRKAKMSQCKIDQKSLKLQIRQHEWAGVQKVREPINSKKNMC
jgi:hypothetical protein